MIAITISVLVLFVSPEPLIYVTEHGVAVGDGYPIEFEVLGRDLTLALVYAIGELNNELCSASLGSRRRRALSPGSLCLRCYNSPKSASSLLKNIILCYCCITYYLKSTLIPIGKQTPKYIQHFIVGRSVGRSVGHYLLAYDRIGFTSNIRQCIEKSNKLWEFMNVCPIIDLIR